MISGGVQTSLSRRELKFSLPGADVLGLCQLLEASTEPVVFAGPVSTVNSIYLDDAQMSSCRDSLSGVGQRTKVRLRWYDAPRPGDLVFFELKRRAGDRVTKERVMLSGSSSLAELPHSSLRAFLTEQLSEEHRCALGVRTQPTALVTYKRYHFVDQQSGIRLTVDYEIIGYDQTESTVLTRRFGSPLEGQVVLEAKLPGTEIDRLREILYPIGPRLSRFSKYVRCCQSLRILWCDS